MNGIKLFQHLTKQSYLECEEHIFRF